MITIIVIINTSTTTIQALLCCKWHVLLYAPLNIYLPFYSDSKRTLIYRHQTRTKNPAHQSVSCAISYYRMSIQMEEECFC